MYQRFAQRGTSLLVLFVSGLLCVFVYARGLRGGFLFDDFPTLVDNPALQAMRTQAHSWLVLALSSNAGILRRPLSMLSFGFDATLFGIDPFVFKVVNL